MPVSFEFWPDGGATSEVWERPKLLQFILMVRQMGVPNFVAIHPILVEIFYPKTTYVDQVGDHQCQYDATAGNHECPWRRCQSWSWHDNGTKGKVNKVSRTLGTMYILYVPDFIAIHWGVNEIFQFWREVVDSLTKTAIPWSVLPTKLQLEVATKRCK